MTLCSICGSVTGTHPYVNDQETTLDGVALASQHVRGSLCDGCAGQLRGLFESARQRAGI